MALKEGKKSARLNQGGILLRYSRRTPRKERKRPSDRKGRWMEEIMYTLMQIVQ